MGLLKWMRGDSDSPSAAMAAAGLGELAGLLQPGKRKQTELIQELKSKRQDIGNDAPGGVDLDRGVAVIRSRGADAGAGEPSATGRGTARLGRRSSEAIAAARAAAAERAAEGTV
ncbi:hypothetical protein Athai_43270 [Actinocatenispora thailandica]|uniref:Uncharacterized protein n=1 Tax=Actinocatenispora thailandica TaxID=227318 RepID=A0A7R7DS50_9ACTN|nr:DUF6191 domain-containing protein [Actinocatenispora thailandica]BCJ36824.1 hypothetical protein Athai_43270 [Actinocatenispora thailandica]